MIECERDIGHPRQEELSLTSHSGQPVASAKGYCYVKPISSKSLVQRHFVFND
jgi:hypothetical protein